jgi:hypothetical protein
MTVEYFLTAENKVGRVGKLDQKIFSKEFEEDILPKVMEENPTFMSWLQIIYEANIKGKPNEIESSAFGEWFIIKTGEKGVDKMLKCCKAFEKDYGENNIKGKLAANAMVDFLVPDWRIEEKQFTETNRMRRLVEATAKKLYKKAKKIQEKNEEMKGL